MDARCRLVLLQFICLVWPSPPHVTVDSFVLRRRSTVDDDQLASDALYLERPGISYVDNVDQYDLLPQDVQDYEMDVPDEYNDDEVTAKLMDIIKQEREEEAAEQDYEDFGGYVDDDDETWAGPLSQYRDDYDSGKEVVGSPVMSLDKAQLRQIFTDTDEQPDEHVVDKKTTELSKNDVEKLFENAATDDNAEVDAAAENSPELDNNTSEIEIKVPLGSSTDVDKIVKSIESVNDGVVGNKVIDVKEETTSPEDGKKLTKEWMVELVQAEGEESPHSRDSGGRKSKRSMDVESEEDEFEAAAKQRAVDLLKTYIELQEEENHHLTEALNLATLAQTQRTDRYIDDEVRHLRHAVGDEAAIETLRDMIRADEDVDENVNDEMKEQEKEEEEEEEGEEYGDDYDYIPAVKRDDREQLSEVFTPASLAEEELDADYDVDDAENHDENAFLRERLRQYLLNKELESIQNQIEDENDYDVNSRWLISKLYPQLVNIYSDSQLNPFTREIDEVDKRYDSDNLDVDDEDDTYVSDPGWLKDVETAAAIANLHDAMKVSTAYDETEVCPAVNELTDNCLAARQRRLALDDEATLLCNWHQFCYTCGAEFGLAVETCDEGYLRDSDRLCSRQSVSGQGLESCQGEAAGLFVIMAEEHHYLPPGATPGICRERCAYDFIVGSR